MLYACDDNWWKRYYHEVSAEFAGELWTQDNRAAQLYGLKRMPGIGAPGLGRTQIHWGGNSGYQAINLAYLWGAARIVLLGYDMKRTGGKSHWFGDHPKGLSGNSPYTKWVENFDRLAADLRDEGVRVVNATRETALTCFDRLPIWEIA